MKKILLIFIVIITYSCGSDKMDSCIQNLIDDGYSYEDAKSECEEARSDSQIRR